MIPALLFNKNKQTISVLKKCSQPFIKVLMFIIVSIIFSSCCYIDGTYTVEINEPVYMTYEELRYAIVSTKPVSISKAGKIFITDQYLFVNDLNRGIHVFDNSDPSSPQGIAYISIPGNVDISVKDNVLYADSFVDLVAIDIQNLPEIEEIKRFKDIFPYDPYQLLEEWVSLTGLNPAKGVVVGYEKTKVQKSRTRCANSSYPAGEGSPVASTASTINGGSTARFTIADSYLYTLSGSSIQVVDIAERYDPKIWNKISIARDIETIFAYDTSLFVGSETGVYIYDISNPGNPELISEVRHFRSCDPVVAQGDYAYVTLRSNTSCRGDINQLDILDITDITRPEIIKSYPMQSPHGLGIDESMLFICDGPAGLKVFDAADPMDIQILEQLDNNRCSDVILRNNLLITTGESGIMQYDYSETPITFLSRISIENML